MYLSLLLIVVGFSGIYVAENGDKRTRYLFSSFVSVLPLIPFLIEFFSTFFEATFNEISFSKLLFLKFVNEVTRSESQMCKFVCYYSNLFDVYDENNYRKTPMRSLFVNICKLSTMGLFCDPFGLEIIYEKNSNLIFVSKDYTEGTSICPVKYFENEVDFEIRKTKINFKLVEGNLRIIFKIDKLKYTVMKNCSEYQYYLICSLFEMMSNNFYMIEGVPLDNSKKRTYHCCDLKKIIEMCMNEENFSYIEDVEASFGYLKPEKKVYEKRKRTYQEAANGGVLQTEGQVEKEEGLRGETSRRVKESEHRETSVDKMQVDEPCFDSKGQPDQLISNGDDGRAHERKEGEVQEENWDRQTVENSTNVVPNFREKQSQMSSDIVKSEQITVFSGYGHQVDLFTDLKSDPADNVLLKLISDMKYSTTTVQEKRFIQAFVEDILRGHLSWGYCLAVETDPQLSRPVRSKLAACNVVRSVLEGAPVETFLRTRGHFENGGDSVEVLMRLLLAIRTMHEGNMLSLVPSPCGVESIQNGRLEKLGFLKQGKDIDVSAVPRKVHNLAMSACCIIDKPWCWGCAVKLGLVAQADLPKFSGQLPQNTLQDVEGSSIFLKADTQQESLKASLVPNLDDAKPISEREILLSFVQGQSICDIEALVRDDVRKMTEKVRAEKAPSVNENLQRLGQVNNSSDHIQSPVQSDSAKLTSSQSKASKFSLISQSTTVGSDRDQCSLLEADISAILRRRAYNALEIMNDSFAARRLYELVLTFQPRNSDSAMMLWLLKRCAGSDGQVVVRDGEQQQGKNSEKEALVSPPAVPVETGNARTTAGWQSLRHKRLLQTLNIARTVVDLMPLCVQLQTAVSRNHFIEDVARLGFTLSNLFEDFLCFLVGIESEPGHTRASEDTAHWRNTQVGAGSAGVALISKVSNPRVLTALANLIAGWLQRCHLVGLTRRALSVERYGVLAGVTAGAPFPPAVGSLPYPKSVVRPVPPRVSPEFGRDVFGVLLEGIVGLPGVVGGDREKGHRWLQGLADIAFEDEAYVKALRLYLQAGAIRSAQYCDRASSMNWDIFTPWVIERMKAACRSVGAGLQAAVLCQCSSPGPDHESAFRILEENTLIMDRDASAYFECIWEVPILELLVHLHSRAGDEARVAKLIGLLQQPALNVHNPSQIRQAHISTMEQRFLQRLAGELL